MRDPYLVDEAGKLIVLVYDCSVLSELNALVKDLKEADYFFQLLILYDNCLVFSDHLFVELLGDLVESVHEPNNDD